MSNDNGAGTWSRIVNSIPEAFKAIGEDLIILVLIILAAASAESLVERLFPEHVSPMVTWLLTLSFGVMFLVYVIKALATLRMLVTELLKPGKDTDAIRSVTKGLPSSAPRTPMAGPMGRRSSDRPIAVMVIDDDALVSKAVRLMLQADPRIGSITTATSPEAAVARIRSGPDDEAPDALLVDVNYRGIEKTGIDSIPEIRAASPRSKLLIMSVSREPETVRAALTNDADGFIWKNESAVDFAEAVVSATRHSFVSSKSVARDMVLGPEAD